MFGPKFVLRNMKEPRGRMAAAVVSGKVSRISGLNSRVLDLPSTISSGRLQIESRWGLSSSGTANNCSSGVINGSSGVLSSTGTAYQHTQRSSIEDISQDARSSATYQILKTKPLTTHEEEEAFSSSFNVL
jgi:hypothetical protein